MSKKKRGPGRPKGSGKPISERLWAHLDEGDANDCWLWKGAKNSNGHGCIWDGTRVVPAHHAAFLVFYGKHVPKLHYLMRTCKDKLCCNPRHFELLKTKAAKKKEREKEQEKEEDNLE